MKEKLSLGSLKSINGGVAVNKDLTCSLAGETLTFSKKGYDSIDVPLSSFSRVFDNVPEKDLNRFKEMLSDKNNKYSIADIEKETGVKFEFA